MLLGSSVFSQSFSVSDLTTLYEHDDNFFDSYVLKRGYAFKEFKQNTASYALKNDLSANNMICYNYSSDASSIEKRSRNIVWIFASDATYLNFKDSLITAGFEAYPSEKDDSPKGRKFTYTNHTYIITIESHRFNNSLNPMYFVFVVKI